MAFVLAIVVFLAVTLAAFAVISLFDERKARARILRDRLTNADKAAEQPTPEAALLRDEMLSKIPAFDTLLRRSDRVSDLQKVLAQGNVDIRAGNFLMLCGLSAVASRKSRCHLRRQARFRLGWLASRILYSLRIRFPYAHQALQPSLKRNFPRPSTPSPAQSAPATPLPPLSK